MFFLLPIAFIAGRGLYLSHSYWAVLASVLFSCEFVIRVLVFFSNPLLHVLFTRTSILEEPRFFLIYLPWNVLFIAAPMMLFYFTIRVTFSQVRNATADGRTVLAPTHQSLQMLQQRMRQHMRRSRTSHQSHKSSAGRSAGAGVGSGGSAAGGGAAGAAGGGGGGGSASRSSSPMFGVSGGNEFSTPRGAADDNSTNDRPISKSQSNTNEDIMLFTRRSDASNNSSGTDDVINARYLAVLPAAFISERMC